MIPSTGGGGQQVECCMCAFFCLSSYNLHKVIMIKSKDLTTLPSTFISSELLDIKDPFEVRLSFDVSMLGDF